MTEIMVSVCCLAYNHCKYIRSALEGFVNQKTNFKFEVIIHDDASEDGTADIIKEYEKKYPEIIKPIYQTKNQYSKRVNITNTFILPKTRGKYLASCEGDDYWIDDRKLQKQVDYLESHPNCTFCFTNAYIEDQIQNKRERKIFLPYDDKEAEWFPKGDKDYTLANAYEIGFAPTASFVFPKNTYLEIKDCGLRCKNADLQLRLFLTAVGYAHFINIPTSVYRINVPNSETSKWKTGSKEQTRERALQAIKMLENIDNFTKGKYSEGLWQFEAYYILEYISCSNLKVLKKDKCRKAFKEVSVIKKIKIIAKMYLSDNVINRIQKLRGRLS